MTLPKGLPFQMFVESRRASQEAGNSSKRPEGFADRDSTPGSPGDYAAKRNGPYSSPGSQRDPRLIIGFNFKK